MMVNVKNYIKKEVIRRCPYCHQDIMIKKGLSSENIKRLFRKPTLEDCITLFIILLTISSFLVYTYEIKAYKEYINNNCPIGQHNQQNTEIYLPGGLETFNRTNIDGNDSNLINTTKEGENGKG